MNEKHNKELTPKERLLIIKNLIHKSCITCTNRSCRVEAYEKIGLDENGLPQGTNCLSWMNDEIVEKAKKLKTYDIRILKEKTSK